MDTTSIVLFFYSKYSTICSDLGDKIQGKLSYRKICVDHPNIRNTILCENEKYCIRYVPCFLVFYANGMMNKYEGEKALEWAHAILDKMNYLEKSKTHLMKDTQLEEPLEIISLDEINQNQNQNQSESSSSTMTRKIDTTPLIDPQSRNESSLRMDSHLHEKKVLEKKSENNILNIAQQLQSQREQEDELKHVDKLKSVDAN